MTRLKRSLGVFSGFLALALLGGCLGGDDSKGGSSSFSIAADAEVDEIETPDADAGIPGILSTTKTTYSCVDGEAEEDENQENYNYAITGGFLYLWQGASCTAMKFSGTSSKIQGTWTSTDLSTRLPSKYRPLSCEGVTPQDNQYESFLKDPVVTYVISSSKVKGTVKGEFCYVAELTEQFKDMEDVEVVSSNCSTVKVRNEDVGRTATISRTYADNKVTQSVAYNGKTCKIVIPTYLSTQEPKCPAEDEDLQEASDEFQDCLEESEFTEDFDFGATKTGSNGSRSFKGLSLLPF